MVSVASNGFIGTYFKRRLVSASYFLVLAIVGMLLIIVLPLDNKKGRLCGYYMAQMCMAGWSTLLGMISSNVAGYTKKTTLAAMFTIAYCVGNIIGRIGTDVPRGYHAFC